jgi:hypothetical protein
MLLDCTPAAGAGCQVYVSAYLWDSLACPSRASFSYRHHHKPFHNTEGLSVIKLYCSANALIKEGRYYPALKTLRDLELKYLQSTATPAYSFIKLMKETVPLLRLTVKQATSDELKTFLHGCSVFGRFCARGCILRITLLLALN